MNSAGNKKVSICLCFNFEELLRSKVTFSLIIFKLSIIRLVPVQDLTGWCWLQSHSGFLYDFGSVESALKTKLVDSSFSTCLEEALERSSKYLVSLFVSPKHAADSTERASVSSKTQPCICGKSALFWWHQALLCALGNIHVSMVGTSLEKLLQLDCRYGPVVSSTCPTHLKKP